LTTILCAELDMSLDDAEGLLREDEKRALAWSKGIKNIDGRDRRKQGEYLKRRLGAETKESA
jgi:hypothetical protein